MEAEPWNKEAGDRKRVGPETAETFAKTSFLGLSMVLHMFFFFFFWGGNAEGPFFVFFLIPKRGIFGAQSFPCRSTSKPWEKICHGTLILGKIPGKSHGKSLEIPGKSQNPIENPIENSWKCF